MHSNAFKKAWKTTSLYIVLTTSLTDAQQPPLRKSVMNSILWKCRISPPCLGSERANASGSQTLSLKPFTNHKVSYRLCRRCWSDGAEAFSVSSSFACSMFSFYWRWWQKVSLTFGSCATRCHQTSCKSLSSVIAWLLFSGPVFQWMK